MPSYKPLVKVRWHQKRPDTYRMRHIIPYNCRYFRLHKFIYYIPRAFSPKRKFSSQEEEVESDYSTSLLKEILGCNSRARRLFPVRISESYSTCLRSTRHNCTTSQENHFLGFPNALTTINNVPIVNFGRAHPMPSPLLVSPQVLDLKLERAVCGSSNFTRLQRKLQQ